MLVELTNSTKAEIICESTFLPYQPRWEIRDCSLLVGSYNSGEEHEHHVVTETVGSGNWYKSEFDEFRFDKSDLLLKSIWLQVPEKNIDLENSIRSWIEKDPQISSLRLMGSEYFAPEPTDLRWLDPQGQLLVCIYEHALSDFKNRNRIRIATDVDLMFGDNQLCGWILSNPLHYVIKGWDQPCPMVEDSDLPAIACKYFQLISEDFIEQIEDEDPEILKSLLELNQEAKNINSLGYQREIFCECIESIIEQFYGQLVV
jgi:hypothetical protein